MAISIKHTLCTIVLPVVVWMAAMPLLWAQQPTYNILHIGGSHVQAGFIGQAVRSHLQPSAQRGIIFPYKSIRTNGPLDYGVQAIGHWSASRLTIQSQVEETEVGLTGYAATATQDGLLHFTMRDPRYRVDSVLVLGDSAIVVSIQSDSTFTVSMSAGQVLRGVVPITRCQGGYNYVEAGVNGASTESWLRPSSLFEDDLELFPPDLVILGIGINDGNVPYNDFDPEVFKQNYRSIIRRIRSVSPGCQLLFITNNDCWLSIRGHKRRTNPNTTRVNAAIAELAQEYRALIFDLYAWMGGHGSSSQWVANGLMSRDHIHFTRQGYAVIGDSLYNFINEHYLNPK